MSGAGAGWSGAAPDEAAAPGAEPTPPGADVREFGGLPLAELGWLDEDGLVASDRIREAAARLRGVIARTPLLGAPWLSDAVGAEVRLKAESLQHAGAFKVRGAYNLVASLSDNERRRGVITFSSGNHGQGVALAARLFGIPAVVVMPTTAPAVKRDGAIALGAEVVFEGTTSLERKRRAEAIAAERGLTMVPPFDDPRIIAGQGTVGLEILEDWPEAELILVPIGGGGLLSGIAAWIKRARPHATVIGVEPENACAMLRSRQAGEPITIDATPTIADGLAPVRPGDLTFHHAQRLVDDIVTVSDDQIRAAAAALIRRARLVVEFSGAATVAALLSGTVQPAGRPTVAVLSGGNLEPSLIPELLAL